MKDKSIIMGLDIGGANTDCCIWQIEDNRGILLTSMKEYLPMWLKKDELEKCLEKFKKDYVIDAVIVTTTAELSDTYKSKKEGIFDITQKVMNVFEDSVVKFVTFKGLKDYKYVKVNPLDMAAANWIATSHIISKISDNCIFMDMGTTTTDIIPIENQKEIAQGHSDLERLCSGELVYTGMLRTNVATITNKIPINNQIASVSSELFATTADVHRVLENITQDEYTCSTSDGEDKSVLSCKRRLARVVCADLDSLSDENVMTIARYIEKKQIEQITEALEKVSVSTNIDEVIITNYADSDICKRASSRIGLKTSNLNEYLSDDSTNVSPTIGCVQMYIDEYLNKDITLLKRQKNE